jgi:hypothetical protein
MARTRAWVVGLIRRLSAFPLSTTDTVETDRFAVLAMSFNEYSKLMLKLINIV